MTCMHIYDVCSYLFIYIRTYMYNIPGCPPVYYILYILYTYMTSHICVCELPSNAM